MKTYQGTRGTGGQTAVTVEDSTAVSPLAGRHDLRNHSPDGLEWGYAGSGPAQLALALLADHFGADPGGVRLAAALYQDFKFEVVARLPRDGWTLTGEQIGQTLCRLATDDEAHFWSRVIGALDAELFGAAVEKTGQEPDSAELQTAAVRIIARSFAVTEDYACRLVVGYYAREGQP